MKGRILYLTVVDFSSVASRAKSEILRTGGLDDKLVKASYECRRNECRVSEMGRRQFLFLAYS
jgi:hypothetical protein